MPPFQLLCHLLDTWLAGRPVGDDLVAAVAAPDVPWPRLVTLSGVHLLTPALAEALAAPHLAARLPEELRSYLRAIREAAAERNQRLHDQLEQVALRLNDVEIVPLALKGAIRLVDGLWPDPALRFMHDLDLLVPQPTLRRSVERLLRDGWRQIDGDESEADHHVVLVHPEAEARVELHVEPVVHGLKALLPAARTLARARPAAVGSAMIAVPLIEDQLVHLVAHGMLQHDFVGSGRFLLRDLVEQALLARSMTAGELHAARDRFVEPGLAYAWDVSVALAGRCLPHSWAHPGHDGLVARCLVRRMLLQQRSPALMQFLGPAGWTVGRLLGHVTGGTAAGAESLSWRQLIERLALFRRKTRW